MRFNHTLSTPAWPSYVRGFLIFSLGAGALYLAEFIIIATQEPQTIADWTRIKAVILIGGQLTLLGLDQVIIREPRSQRAIIRLSLVLVTGLSLIVMGGFLWVAPASPIAIVGPIGMALFAISILIFATTRSAGRIDLAYLARDGWKVGVLILVALMVITDTDTPITWVLTAALTIAVLPLWPLLHMRQHTARQHHFDVSTLRSALRAGLPFYLAALSLALGSYGELLLLNIFAADSEIARYFKLALLFSYPSLLLTTFTGSILSVSLRDNPDRARILAKLGWPQLFGLAWVLTGVLWGAGAGLCRLIFPEFITLTLPAVLLAWSGAIRLTAALSTSGITALLARKPLERLSLNYGLSAIACMTLLAYALKIGFDPVLSAAAALALYWTYRFFIAFRAYRTLPESIA